jgi:hypothetical protein
LDKNLARTWQTNGKFLAKTWQAKSPNRVRGQACRLEWRLLRSPLALARRMASSSKSVGSATRTGRHGIKLATFSPAAFDVPCVGLRAARSPIVGGVSVMAEKPRNRLNKTEDQPLARPQIFHGNR